MITHVRATEYGASRAIWDGDDSVTRPHTDEQMNFDPRRVDRTGQYLIYLPHRDERLT